MEVVNQISEVFFSSHLFLALAAVLSGLILFVSKKLILPLIKLCLVYAVLNAAYVVVHFYIHDEINLELLSRSSKFALFGSFAGGFITPKTLRQPKSVA